MAEQNRSAPSALEDPEGCMRHFEQRMAAMRGKGEQMSRLLADIEVRVESEEREVAVTVNMGGAPSGIEFGPSAKHLSGQGLAEPAIEVYRQAAAEASQKAAGAMSDLLGADSETAGFLRQAVNRYAPKKG